MQHAAQILRWASGIGQSAQAEVYRPAEQIAGLFSVEFRGARKFVFSRRQSATFFPLFNQAFDEVTWVPVPYVQRAG